MIILWVTETRQRRGRFNGTADGYKTHTGKYFNLGQIVASSRQPFLDAARALLAKGVNPETMLLMRHASTGTDSLKATVGAAAKLTVAERQHNGPRFEPWQPHPAHTASDDE